MYFHGFKSKSHPTFMKWLVLLIGAMLWISCNNKPKSAPIESGVKSEINKAELIKMLINNDDVMLIDVRTPEEIAEGKINGAIEINYHDKNFESLISQLDRDQHYVVYCKSGGRSGKTVEHMNKVGFKQCTNLIGGYSNWKKK